MNCDDPTVLGEFKMLLIATDSATDIPAGWQQEFDIHVIPINIQFGEKTYLQNIDLDAEGFYRLVDESGNIPKTSQPSPHQFKEFYRKIARQGDTILSIHVTSKLSGTFESAVAAARDLKDEFKVIPFDSAAGSVGIAFMCREARKMDQAGKSVEQIVKYLEDVRPRLRIILTLDKLDYARISGRVGTLAAALVSMLNVKPIAVLQDGFVNMAEKVRTRKAAIERVIEMAKEQVGDQLLYLAVVQARDYDAGRSLLEKAVKSLNVRDSVLTELSVSLAANLGPGTVGLVLYPAE
jgi:DegV family protein with EDD domain